MDSTITAAIITAIAAVAVAIITVVAKKHRGVKGSHPVKGLPRVDKIVSGGHTIIGDRNIVETIINTGVSSEEFRRLESDRYKELGRAKVQEWGQQLSREGSWSWDLLGHALDHYVDAIRRDPTNQHPWTNLAFVLHLTGEKRKAYEALARSYELAGPGPNHPGNNYKQVKRAVVDDAYLTGGRVQRPPIPDWFWKKHGRLPGLPR